MLATAVLPWRARGAQPRIAEEHGRLHLTDPAEGRGDHQTAGLFELANVGDGGRRDPAEGLDQLQLPEQNLDDELVSGFARDAQCLLGLALHPVQRLACREGQRDDVNEAVQPKRLITRLERDGKRPSQKGLARTERVRPWRDVVADHDEDPTCEPTELGPLEELQTDSSDAEAERAIAQPREHHRELRETQGRGVAVAVRDAHVRHAKDGEIVQVHVVMHRSQLHRVQDVHARAGIGVAHQGQLGQRVA